MPTFQQVVGYSLVALLAVGGSYAIYFDHKRRSDPQFRKQLSMNPFLISY